MKINEFDAANIEYSNKIRNIRNEMKDIFDACRISSGDLTIQYQAEESINGTEILSGKFFIYVGSSNGQLTVDEMIKLKDWLVEML